MGLPMPSRKYAQETEALPKRLYLKQHPVVDSGETTALKRQSREGPGSLGTQQRRNPKYPGSILLSPEQFCPAT